MKKTTYVVTCFRVCDGFYVEVSASQYETGVIEFYLCREGHGIKKQMFGMHEKECPPEMWEDMIERNVDEHISHYLDEYV